MPYRNAPLISVPLLLLALLTGCGNDADVKPAAGDAQAATAGEGATGDPSADSSAEEQLPSEEDLEELFNALASTDVAALEEAVDLTGAGSIAAGIHNYMLAGANAAIDAGIDFSTEGAGERIDGGYEFCSDPADEESCIRWTDIEGADGKVVNFAINGESLRDRITVGNGRPVKAGQIADIALLYAYQSPVSNNLFVVASAKSHDGEVELSNAYSATYRDPSGRQFTAADATTPSTLRPNSTATFTITFPAPAKIGGVTRWSSTTRRTTPYRSSSAPGSWPPAAPTAGRR